MCSTRDAAASWAWPGRGAGTLRRGLGPWQERLAWCPPRGPPGAGGGFFLVPAFFSPPRPPPLSCSSLTDHPGTRKRSVRLPSSRSSTPQADASFSSAPGSASVSAPGSGRRTTGTTTPCSLPSSPVPDMMGAYFLFCVSCVCAGEGPACKRRTKLCLVLLRAHAEPVTPSTPHFESLDRLQGEDWGNLMADSVLPGGWRVEVVLVFESDVSWHPARLPCSVLMSAGAQLSPLFEKGFVLRPPVWRREGAKEGARRARASRRGRAPGVLLGREQTGSPKETGSSKQTRSLPRRRALPNRRALPTRRALPSRRALPRRRGPGLAYYAVQ